MGNSKKSIIVILIGIVALTISVLYIRNKESELFQKPSLYTVGRVDDSYAVVGYFDFEYSFIYQDETYMGKGTSNKKLKKGKKFVAKFSKENPYNSKLILELPVCDSIIEMSQINWESIPKRIICPDE